MTGEEFRSIRLKLEMSQQALADLLGYRHKIRVSEFERGVSRVPEHIARAMRVLSTGNRLQGKQVRQWTAPFFSESLLG